MEDEDQIGRGDVIGVFMNIQVSHVNQPESDTNRAGIRPSAVAGRFFGRSYGLEHLLNRRATARLLLVESNL
jgi:hypothetical protein